MPNGYGTSKDPIQPHQCVKLVIQSQNDHALLYNIVKQNMSIFSQSDGQGVIFLVYSVIMTRTIGQVREDMDL